MLNNTAKKVFKYFFMDNFKISLWFIAIYALSITIIDISSNMLSENYIGFGHADTFAISVTVFMFVIGICMYSTALKEFVYQGVTRNDFFRGLVTSAVLLTLFFSAVILLIAIVETIISNGPLLPLRFVHIVIPPMLMIFLCYMCGLMIGITFSGYGVLRGLGSIIVSIIIINLLMNLNSDTFTYVTIPNSYLHSRIYLTLAATLLGGVIVTVINYLLNKNISVKVQT